MTKEEEEIMGTILNGDFEVPFAPTFLKRTYTTEQQAAFSIYLESKIHYTLTAKLAPDQNISATLEPHAIRNFNNELGEDAEVDKLYVILCLSPSVKHLCTSLIVADVPIVDRCTMYC